MLSSDFTNTWWATPVSKDSALNKNIRDFKLPKFSQFSRFKRDQNLNPQSSNNLTVSLYPVLLLDKVIDYLSHFTPN